MTSTNIGKGYAAAIAASICTAAMYGVGKWLLEGLTPIHLVALIFSIAAIVMGIAVAATQRWREFRRCSLTGWLLVLLFSGLSIAAIITMWTGIQHLDPTIASFISRVEVLIAIVLGMLFLRERFRLAEGVGGVVILIGLIVIRITFDLELSLWFWVMVTSGVLFGLTEFVAKLTVRHLAPIPLTFVRNLIIGSFFLILTVSKGIPLFDIGGYWWGVLVVAITGPALGRIFYLIALKHIEISKASLITQTKPLFVAIIAFSVLGMIPSPREWTGGILILIGCATIIMTRPHHSRNDA